MTQTHYKTHQTIVLGWDYWGQLVYCRTFDFGETCKVEKYQALQAFDFVSTNCDTYLMGDAANALHKSKFIKEEED